MNLKQEELQREGGTSAADCQYRQSMLGLLCRSQIAEVTTRRLMRGAFDMRGVGDRRTTRL